MGHPARLQAKQIRGQSATTASFVALDLYIRCTYTLGVGYEWDQAKAAANMRKHGINFADAAIALEDDRGLTIEDPFSHSEERFVTLCRDPFGEVLVVVFTWRGEEIRLISARKATGRERRLYEEGP